MIRLVSFILFLGATTTYAETVSMRSGEHEGFSRIVLYIPPDIDWELRETERGYRVELGAPVNAIDTAGVFERLPRSRLVDLQSEGADLSLIVECECYINAFIYNSTMLVVDVLDGTAPNDTVPARPITATDGTTTASWFGTPATEDQTTAVELSSESFPLFFAQDTSSAFHPDIAVELVAPVPPDTALIDAERRIVESFARAATQGVFDFPALPVLDNIEPLMDMRSDDIFPGVLVPSAMENEGGPGFSMRTGLDLDAVSAATDEHTSSCPIQTNLDINTWGERDAFGTVIPELRLSIINEAGDNNDRAVLELAKAYIYYGFGAEARETLRLLTSPQFEAELLGFLAHLIDHEPVPIADLLAFRSCDSSMELWLALAGNRVTASDDETSSAIIIAYRALPDTLRGHLGLRLAQIFSQAGAYQTAEDILSSALQEMTGDTRDVAIAQAGLAGQTLGPEAEIAQLEPFIETSSRAVPEDMIRLMDLARETDTSLDERVLELSEAMRFEEGGSQNARDLFDAEVRLLLQQEQPFSALELIAANPEALVAEHIETLRSEAATTVAQTASDAEFLDFAFSTSPREMGHVAQNAIASRLISNGFMERAQAYLLSDAEADVQVERLRLRSLLPYTGRQTAPLETQSVMTADAADEPPIEQTILPETELSEAWRSGEWETLANSGDPLLGTASRALLSPVTSNSAETPLADSSALLEDTQLTRELTSELLERFSIDE